jgi:hypothetical protein
VEDRCGGGSEARLLGEQRSPARRGCMSHVQMHKVGQTRCSAHPGHSLAVAAWTIMQRDMFVQVFTGPGADGSRGLAGSELAWWCDSGPSRRQLAKQPSPLARRAPLLASPVLLFLSPASINSRTPRIAARQHPPLVLVCLRLC